jgi:hypothetical protein
MSKANKLAERIDELEAEYRSLLLKALRECAAGRWGLFGHNEHLVPMSEPPHAVEELTDLAQVIDTLRLRIDLEPFPLHQRFRAARGRASANAIGEPKQAQTWLTELGEG